MNFVIDDKIYITPFHIEKDYLCIFPDTIAKIISKKRGNDIIVLDENKNEIYNGDMNNYFYNNILQEPKTKCLSSIVNDDFGSIKKVDLPHLGTTSPSLKDLLTTIDSEKVLNMYFTSKQSEESKKNMILLRKFNIKIIT
jgi:hypothetical protein